MFFRPKVSRRQSGQSLTEMALTLPILLLLIMGIMDFGRMLFMYSQISNAAREGARFGSVVGLNELDQFSDCESIRQATIDKLGLDFVPDEIDIRYDDGATLINPTCNGATGPGRDVILPGYRILVRVNARFSFLTPFVREIAPELPVSFTAARTILVGGVQIPPDE